MDFWGIIFYILVPLEIDAIIDEDGREKYKKGLNNV